MYIMYHILMTATRMPVSATSAQQPLGFRFPSVLRQMFRQVARLANPFRTLAAYRELSRFRSMDIALLQDVGLTQEAVDRATLSEFVKATVRRK